MFRHNTLSLLALLLLGAAQRGGADLLTDAQSTDVLKEHNVCRSNVNPAAADMRMLTYNATLANVAQSYAMQCIYAHNSNSGGTGENLCYRSTPDLAACVTAWCNERNYYTFATGQCNAPPDPNTCLHYTQVVWSNTSSVGCATKFCEILKVPNGADINKVYLTVCNYYPAGNIQGQKPYASGTSCSACSPNTCNNNLCASDAKITTTPTTPTTPTGGAGAPGIKSGPVTLFTAFLLAGLPLLAF